MKKQKVYKLEYQENFYISSSLSDVTDTINSEIEDNYSEGDEPLEFSLSVIEMTEEEIKDLPEFDGF